MMFPWRIDDSGRKESLSQAVPVLCLLGVVALLSSITPVMKYVLQHSGLTFLSVANVRIVIGFLFLAGITACWDWKGLRALGISDAVRLGLLGLLGVGSYVVAAYGLLYTNVTHYALIYSLLPTFTAFFSWCLAKEHLSWSSLAGIILSWAGCSVALASNLDVGAIEVGFGDPLVLLFTLMMAAHIVLSTHIVRRHGVLIANTAMFGSSAVLISGCAVAWGDAVPPADLRLSVLSAVLFIGLGTAGVFLLRSRALQSLTPATVGAYHNLIPICTIGIAHWSFGESLTMQTAIGGFAVLLGTQMVRNGPRWITFLAVCLSKKDAVIDSRIVAPAGLTLVRSRLSTRGTLRSHR
jgi:drug/metabolite transporter (DMT)-like permease